MNFIQFNLAIYQITPRIHDKHGFLALWGFWIIQRFLRTTIAIIWKHLTIQIKKFRIRKLFASYRWRRMKQFVDENAIKHVHSNQQEKTRKTNRKSDQPCKHYRRTEFSFVYTHKHMGAHKTHTTWKTRSFSFGNIRLWICNYFEVDMEVKGKRNKHYWWT